MLGLLLGTLLAVGALTFVLYPLFAGVIARPAPLAPTRTQAAVTEERDAVAALREIEFDRVTGKLSDSDYAELKARYTERALSAMRRGEAASVANDDPAEAAVRAYRARLHVCVRCGPRPEADALYCSNCALYLPGRCGTCDAAVTLPSAAFCNSCGTRLAA